MLTIHSVNPTGLFSYGECNTIQLDNSGLIHLVGVNEDKGGDSNGSGKSSLFNSTCELLYGDNPTGVKNAGVVNSVWNKGTCARLEFTSHENIRYRITYCRGWKKDLYPVDNDNKVSYVGTSLFLDKFVDGVWRDDRGAGMPQTRQKILDAIGIPYDRFISVCYMSSRIGSSFIRGTTKERVDLLSGITGVYEWDKILERARSQKRNYQSQIEAIQRKIAYETGAVDSLKSQIKSVNVGQINVEIKSKEAFIESLRSQYETLKEKIKGVETDIANLVTERDNSYNQDLVKRINSEIDALNKEYNKITYVPETHVVVPKELENAIAESGNKINFLKGKLGSIQSESAKLLDMKDCPLCGGKVSEKKKTNILDKIHEIEEEIEQELKNYQERKIEYDTFVYNAIEENKRQNEVKRVEKDNLLKQVEDKRKESSMALEKYTQLNSTIEGVNRQLSVVKDERSKIKSQGESLKSEIDRLRGRLVDHERMSTQVLEKEDAVTALRGEISGVETEIVTYDWLINNIPYIKLHKLSVSMADLSDMINKYLMEMGDSSKVVIKSFDMKKDIKGAADIKDLLKSEIKLEIIDGNKNIDPKLYSDGEIGKISNAFIRGLHDLALRSGYGCNIMMLDEIFSFIDEGNSQKVSDSFTKSVKGKTVFITDNSGRVRDLVNFDKVWVVRKKNGQSKIEV
jgi:DNA repair exonuclease SbcCD ATPase subunit